MGGRENRGNDRVDRTDGGVIQRGTERRGCEPLGSAVHEQSGLERHELPSTIPVWEYHEYHHDDRWTEAEAPLAADGDSEVDWLASDEWLVYDVDIRESGPYDLTLEVASATDFGGGDVGIIVDDKPLGHVEFDATGGWYTWDDVRTQVELPRGIHTIRLVVFEGGWKLRKLRFR